MGLTAEAACDTMEQSRVRATDVCEMLDHARSKRSRMVAKLALRKWARMGDRGAHHASAMASS
jgi:hypothetical protein